jgi:hypothetical protein
VPWLGFIEPTQNIMVEYGYLHGDTSKVSFRSRLTLDQLRTFELKSSEEGAPDLDSVDELESRGDRSFRELLLSNTYLYEGRLHQLRRDQNLKRAETSQQHDKKAQYFAAAYWENAILKEYFSKVLLGTRYEWSPKNEAEVMARANLTMAYSSSISTHLLIAFSARQLALLTIGYVVFFLGGALVCNHALARNGNA